MFGVTNGAIQFQMDVEKGFHFHQLVIYSILYGGRGTD